MKKRLFLVPILMIMLLLGLSSCKSNIKGHGGNLTEIVNSGNLVIGTNAEYAPFEYIDSKTGKVTGYDIDIIKLIEKEIEKQYNVEINVVIKDMAFAGLIGSMNANQIDFIAAAFSKNEEREAALLFTDIYYKAQTVLVVKKDYKGITDYESLKGKKLGAQMGTVQVDFASEAAGGDSLALDSLATLSSSLKVGNLDALVVEKPIAQNIISKNSGFEIIDTIKFADDDGYGIATNKGNIELVTLINKVIAENQANGKLEELFYEALQESLSNDISSGLDFKPVLKYLPQFAKGALGTIGFALATIIFGSILGFFLCLAHMSKHKLLKYPAKFYIQVVRGTPLLIQLYIFAFGIPMLFPSLNIGVVMAGILALGLNSTAYVAEIFRAGIESVDPGQMEAARSMGFSSRFSMWKIVFPQAIRNIIPSIGNEFITIVKESSVVSIIGIYDITRVSDLVKASTLKVFEALIVAAVMYLVITTILSKLIKYAERRLTEYAKR